MDKKSKCMLFPGNLEENFLLKLSEINSCEIIFITEHLYQKNRAIKCVDEDKTFFCDDILIDKRFSKIENLNLLDLEKIDSLIKKLYTDICLIWIAERTHRKGGLVSNFIFSNHLILIVKSLFLFFKFIQPDRLIFSTAPHKVETYILAKIAEIFEIPIIFGNGDPVTKKTTPVNGIYDFISITNKKADFKANQEAKQIISKLSGSYLEAKPDYLKSAEFQALTKQKNNIVSYQIEFKDFIQSNNLRKIYTFFNIYQKFMAFNFYKKMSKSFKLPKDYLVFFLQYQPERTSTPDGGIFAAHAYCINLISMTLSYLKCSTKIVIKEHPSQFQAQWNNAFRSVSFYNDIAKLDNVIFAPLEKDSFELIDKSLCVATINGTVIFEGAARGKPTLSFGPKSKTFKWNMSYNIQSFDDIYMALTAIIKNKDKNNDKIIVNSFEKFLSERIVNGFDVSFLNTSLELFEFLCTCDPNRISAMENHEN